MLFIYNFYSSFLLVFFIHTLVYAGLFLVRYRRQSQQSSLWLGLFLLLAAMYITPWMLGFAGWYGTQPYRDILFYVPFQHLFLIGPCVFFYISSLFNPSFRITGRQWLHFIPAALYIIFSLVMLVYDKCIAHAYYFLKNEQDPDFDSWYQLAGFISMITYFIACLRYYNAYKRAIEAVISNAADFLFSWVRNFLLSFLVILAAWFVVAILDLLYGMNFNNSWWYFLGFALCCYYIAIAGYSNSVETKLFFKSNFFQSEKETYLLKPAPAYKLGYEPSELEEVSLEAADAGPAENYTEWKNKIAAAIEKNQLFENPELTLFDLALRVNTNVSLLSKIINRAFGSNFNDLINGYRVQKFIALIEKGEHKKHTLLSIAFDCGFNSKTTFNRAFKKSMGLNPQQYLKQHKL